jgi:hypothetical protein
MQERAKHDDAQSGRPRWQGDTHAPHESGAAPHEHTGSAMQCRGAAPAGIRGQGQCRGAAPAGIRGQGLLLLALGKWLAPGAVPGAAARLLRPLTWIGMPLRRASLSFALKSSKGSTPRS